MTAPAEDASSKPGGFASGLDGNAVESLHPELDTVESPETLWVAMAPVYGQEGDAVLIAVFDLGSQLADNEGGKR